MKYLDELKDLDLPAGEYAIFGSGPICIRGLRENGDIDLLVTEKLWKELIKKYPVDHNCISLGNIEIWADWPVDNWNRIVKEAETIDGFPFVQLEYVLRWKKFLNREKDKQDVKLIEDYLLKNQ